MRQEITSCHVSLNAVRALAKPQMRPTCIGLTAAAVTAAYAASNRESFPRERPSICSNLGSC